MTHSITTAGQLFASDQFDPMTLEIGEIKELSNAMPRDGHIDINQAEVLATKYLRGADICSELLALATSHMAKTKDAKQKAYNYAFLVKSQTMKNIKTDKMRVAYAELDDEYLAACEAFNKATAFLKWVELKYNIFNKVHYLCKKMLDREYTGEKSAGWNGSGTNIEEGW